MSMTKKDYELIAGILAKAYSKHGGWSLSANEVIGDIEEEFCRKLETENPRFNKHTFSDFIYEATEARK
jgi:hypothetical protein